MKAEDISKYAEFAAETILTQQQFHPLSLHEIAVIIQIAINKVVAKG